MPRAWRSRVLLSLSVSLCHTHDPGPGPRRLGERETGPSPTLLSARDRRPPRAPMWPLGKTRGRDGGAQAQPRPGCAPPRMYPLPLAALPAFPAAAELDPAARDHGPPPTGPAAVAAARPAGGRGGPQGAAERAAEPGVGPRVAGGCCSARPLFLSPGRQLRGPKPHSLAPR